VSEYLSLLVRTYYDVQGQRIALNNRLLALQRNEDLTEERGDKLQAIFKENLEAAETETARLIKAEVRDLPIWQHWLRNVKGIGPTFAAVLQSKIIEKRQAYYQHPEHGPRWGPHPDDLPEHAREGLSAQYGEPTGEVRHGLACFPKRASLHAYCGLATDGEGQAQRRKKGQQANWNRQLKTAAFLIGESFTKTKGAYRAAYDYYRAAEDAKGDAKSKAHALRRSQRKAVKLFLSHLWLVGRLEQGLPVEPPYPQGHLGHSHFIPPLRDVGEFPEQWQRQWRQWGELPAELAQDLPEAVAA